MTMQTNLLWKGLKYSSLENCLVNSTDSGSEVKSMIIGLYEEKIFQVDYVIRTNQNWETVFFEFHSQYSDQREHSIFESDGKGNWIMNGNSTDEFKGCIDIDIPLTPFTNTLPIKRLQLSKGTEQEIQVLYLDLLKHQIRSVKQKYARLSNFEYQYENIPNDFEAKITVDELGFVIDYPMLFVITAIEKTNYR